MKVAEIPKNEAERLQALEDYNILDTLPEQDFEDITKIASEICQTPIALITLIDSDRQWFKSNRGLNVTETPRDYAFCAHAINSKNKIFTVKDSRKDERFVDNPLVTGYPNVIFYAGVSLINPAGFSLGTICVIDNEPRELSKKQLDSLRALSNQVVKLFEFRKLSKLLNESKEEIQARNAELEQFSYMISHDIKTPLHNIIGLIELLKENDKVMINQEGEEIIDHIATSSSRLNKFIDGIISHSMGVNLDVDDKQEIVLANLFKELLELVDSKGEYQINYSSNVKTIKTNEVAIKQILLNLISNAIKYNDKDKVKIDIKISSKPKAYKFMIKDNGPGIEESQHNKIFETFYTLGGTDRFNNSGTGIGLATVKKLIEKLEGNISIEAALGKRTAFKFSIKK